MRRRKKAKQRTAERVPLVQADAINQTWSLDFVSGSLANGRRIKCLTVIDDFSRESAQIGVDFGINAGYVTRLLDQAAHFRGYPKAIRSENEVSVKANLRSKLSEAAVTTMTRSSPRGRLQPGRSATKSSTS